jgi:ATP-dependent Clp protease adaptor protein ClpS
MPARTSSYRRKPGTIERKAMPQKPFTVMTGETRSIGDRMPRVAMSKVAMSKDDGRRAGTGPGTSVMTRTKARAKRPSLYRVLILNDDYTPMEFVVHVLERFFQKDVEAATQIMLHVHHHGIGECGIFTYEIAETKVTQVMDFARKHQHPLQCVMEKK